MSKEAFQLATDEDPVVAVEAVRPAHIKQVKLLTPGEVCALFNVCNNTVRNWAERWPDRFVTIRTPGGHRRFKAEPIARLLEEGWNGARSGPRLPGAGDDPGGVH